MADIHSSWQRDFDVYDRLNALGIDLGAQTDAISDPRGRRICNLTFTPSGGEAAATFYDIPDPFEKDEIAIWSAKLCFAAKTEFSHSNLPLFG